KLDPANLYATSYLLETEVKLNQWKECEKLKSELKPAAATNLAAATALAKLSISGSDYLQAISYLKTAIAANPKADTAHALAVLGRSYLRVGDSDSAKAVFAQASRTAHSPYMSKIYINLVHLINADYTASQEDCRQAGKILPDDPLWITSLAT